MRASDPRPGVDRPFGGLSTGERGTTDSSDDARGRPAGEPPDRSGRGAPASFAEVDAEVQAAFAERVCRSLRDSRKRQRLTQAEVAGRTHGLVSKAALANYETGHRSLRIEVFWILARALGEDPGELLFAAEQSLSLHLGHQAPSVVIDPDVVRSSEDVRLAPVRRWVELRQNVMPGGVAAGPMVLDAAAVAALAALMQLTPAECVLVLKSLAGRPTNGLPTQTRP